VTVIIKEVTSNKNYRMESNAANFFSECGLLDKDTTYRIFHLTKNIVIIEYVSNLGTLSALIEKCFPENKRLERMAL
jgi:hypothetical protein